MFDSTTFLVSSPRVSSPRVPSPRGATHDGLGSPAAVAPATVAPLAIDPDVAFAAELRDMVLAVPAAETESGLVDQIAELERVKGALAARQARLTVDLDRRRAAAAAARTAASDRGRHTARLADRDRRLADRGLAREIGFARRESPYDGGRKLSLSRALVHDLPHTMAALERGDLNERRAEIIATETAHLDGELRGAIDAALSDPGGGASSPGAHRFDGVSDAELRDEVRREVLTRGDESAAKRFERARARRRISGRSLGDGMGRITADLPVEEMRQTMLALSDAAEAALNRVRQQGSDPNEPARPAERPTRSQLMADIFVRRITGRLLCDDPASSAPRVALKIVVPASTLLADGRTPAYVEGVGYLSAKMIRTLIERGSHNAASTWQRLFTMRDTDTLIAMDSKSSLFGSGLAEFINTRDRRCRTPWCQAPIRHRDHVIPGPKTARPLPTTAKGCARRATTPRSSPAGTTNQCQIPSPSARSPSPHRPATSTQAEHRPNHAPST